MFPTVPSARILVANPSFGVSPSGFRRLHLELLPREVSRLVGYDPRSLVIKPRKPGAKIAKGTRDMVPHNVSQSVVNLQNQVQRSIDISRVAQMVQYLADAMELGKFADWGAIDLVTSSDPQEVPGGAALDSDADYFIADGQHRFCALLDFIRAFPHYADRFTQGVTISVLPADKLVMWAGQEFHDRNYFAVAVRAGKALSVDSRDPVNALARDMDTHPVVVKAGGIAYERDTLLTGDPRFASHATIHRFVKGFLFGRPGLDRSTDTRVDIDPDQRTYLWQYMSALGDVLPWADPERDGCLTRASVVMAALSVIGHDLYSSEAQLTPEERTEVMYRLSTIDWRRRNLGLVGVVGSEKNGLVQPASSRQAIDSTIRYLRERLGLLKPNGGGDN